MTNDAMLHHDGEEILGNPSASQQAECVDYAYLGQLVRTLCETQTDDAENYSAAWSNVRARIDSSNTKSLWEKLGSLFKLSLIHI